MQNKNLEYGKRRYGFNTSTKSTRRSEEGGKTRSEREARSCPERFTGVQYLAHKKPIENQQDGTSSTCPTMQAHQCHLTFYQDEKKSGESHFPGVKELMRCVLPCTPLTDHVERIFSVTGQVESGQKYLLLDVSLAMLTILQET